MHLVHLCLYDMSWSYLFLPAFVLELSRWNKWSYGVAKQADSKAIWKLQVYSRHPPDPNDRPGTLLWRDLRSKVPKLVTGTPSFNTIWCVWHWGIPPNSTLSREHGDRPMGTLFSENGFGPCNVILVNLSQLWGENMWKLCTKSSAEEQREKKIPWCTWCR